MYNCTEDDTMKIEMQRFGKPFEPRKEKRKNRTFKVDEPDVDYWLDNYVIGQNTYVLSSLLYPKLKLSQVSFHQDHN